MSLFWHRFIGMSQIIITAVGPDRPGIVGELTGHLHAAGGNILDSRMVNLRGEFAMMILLELAGDAAGALEQDLPALGQRMGLNISTTPQAPGAQHVSGLPYRLKTYSLDQPGIVARLTNLLRDHVINIEELSAYQQSAAFTGEAIFHTEMKLTIPPKVSLRELRAQLEKLCNDLNCDVDLEPEA
jgi:glycine cleavage system transcriptional repressor